MEKQFNLNSLIYKKKGNKKDEIPYQDQMEAKTFDDGISVIALSDGLGSKSMSDVGAKITVDTAIETLRSLFEKVNLKKIDPEEVRNTLLSKIKKEIEIKSKEDKIYDIKEYACTLLFAVITDENLVVGQLGDGYIVVKKNDNDEPKLAFNPKDESSEYMNSTRTIFDNPKHMQLALGKKDVCNYIFLSSDGTDKLRRNDFKGSYTPFITAKSLGNKPQLKIFDFMGNMLKDSKECELKLSKYSKKDVEDMSDMLVNNVVDDDVTFSFVNPNEKGPTRDVKDMLEQLSKNFNKDIER